MDTKLRQTQSRTFALFSIAATTILGGAGMGASINAINGIVSPTYFRNVMRWHEVGNIWRASIAQGIFEGLILGVIFAMIFTVTIAIVSHGHCSFTFAFRRLLIIAIVIYGCWAAGGLVAMGLAVTSPEFYRKTFIGVPNDFTPMLRYAWVGGSIWGALLGALLASVSEIILFPSQWRRVHLENVIHH